MQNSFSQLRIRMMLCSGVDSFRVVAVARWNKVYPVRVAEGHVVVQCTVSSPEPFMWNPTMHHDADTTWIGVNISRAPRNVRLVQMQAIIINAEQVFDT